MSIGYKKISQMISDQVKLVDGLSLKQKTRFEQLCNKIYMLEASTDSTAATKVIEDLMGEISLTADRLKELGEDS